MGNVNQENWEEQQPYLYWMTSTEGIGSRTIEKLINHAGSPKAVYGMDLPDMLKLIPESRAMALTVAKSGGKVLEKYAKLKESGIHFYSIYHPRYPQRLKNIPDKPYGIYVEGELPEEEIPSIAVIGARQCSSYGCFMADLCGRELAEAGINVISGMARGIDGISQKAALKAGGRTYAVLGCGTDICYPPENMQVYRKAKENGAVISEYPPGTPPSPKLFPRRNRIISGLADLVLIIEAREKSGTLITADMALEQGKEVYVIPGRATDTLSQGCNRMLKQGAGLFTTVKDLLEETGLLLKVEKNISKESNHREHQGTVLGQFHKEASKTENLGLGSSGLKNSEPESSGLKSSVLENSELGNSRSENSVLENSGQKTFEPENSGLENPRFRNTKPRISTPQISNSERKILNALDFYPKDTDRLIDETQIEYRTLIRTLSKLCMEEKAIRLTANQFMKK